jgi:hypothetical protein
LTKFCSVHKTLRRIANDLTGEYSLEYHFFMHEILEPGAMSDRRTRTQNTNPEDPDVFAYDPEINHAPYGPRERMLGVAVDRNLRDASWDMSPTANHYSSVGNLVSIDIEKDNKLFDFLLKVKTTVQAAPKSEPAIDTVERIASQVVKQTPKIDETGELHDYRQLSLGEALEKPVECIDRALAIEASLKMFGYTDACTLFAVDEHQGGKVNHADVWFTLNGGRFVAITMGDLAGRVMPLDLYKDTYIPLRKQQGLGARTLKEDWSERHYFTAISPEESPINYETSDTKSS